MCVCLPLFTHDNCFFLRTVEAALLAVNNAIDSAVAEEILTALQSEVLDLKDVTPEIADYYCDGLVKRKTEKQDVSLALEIYKIYLKHVLCFLAAD